MLTVKKAAILTILISCLGLGTVEKARADSFDNAMSEAINVMLVVVIASWFWNTLKPRKRR